MLVDAILQPGAEPRYRIRLDGGEVVAIQGSDGTGKYVERVPNKSEVAALLQGYREIVRSRKPGYRRASLRRKDASMFLIAASLFRSRAGEHADMLMFVFLRDEKMRRRRRRDLAQPPSPRRR